MLHEDGHFAFGPDLKFQAITLAAIDRSCDRRVVLGSMVIRAECNSAIPGGNDPNGVFTGISATYQPDRNSARMSGDTVNPPE